MLQGCVNWHQDNTGVLPRLLEYLTDNKQVLEQVRSKCWAPRQYANAVVNVATSF
jgi:hypothetical protein